MRPSIVGAEVTFSSRMMAIRRPILAPSPFRTGSPFAIESDRHFRPHVLVVRDLGVREVLASQLGATVQVVAAPDLVLRLLALIVVARGLLEEDP